MKKIILLLVSTILICVFCIYLFAQKSIFSCFDLSNTGQIGDTIGGITSPIINLLSIVFIYLAFNEQIKANNVLYDQARDQKKERNFQIVLELFADFRDSYSKLKYKESYGQAALNIYSNVLLDLKDSEEIKNHLSKPIYFEWQYLICQYDLILEYFHNDSLHNDERERVFILLHNYYHTHLEYSINCFLSIPNKYTEQNTITKLLKRFKKIHYDYSKSN